MEYSLDLNANSSRNVSTAERLMTVQELFLEYSIFVVVMGSMLLGSLALKLFRDYCGHKPGIWLV